MQLGGLAEGGARLQQQVRADAGDMGGAVTAEDIVDHLVAHLPVEIEVDVGQIDPTGVEEPLHLQAEPQRIDVGDAEQVADQRVAGRAAQGHGVAAAADVPRDVAHHQEIAGQPRRADEGQLLAQPLARLQVGAEVAPPQAALAQLVQEARRVHAGPQTGLRQHQIARQDIGGTQLVRQHVAVVQRPGQVAEAAAELGRRDEVVGRRQRQFARQLLQLDVAAHGRGQAERGVVRRVGEVRGRAGNGTQTEAAAAGEQVAFAPARRGADGGGDDLQPQPPPQRHAQPRGPGGVLDKDVQPLGVGGQQIG